MVLHYWLYGGLEEEGLPDRNGYGGPDYFQRGGFDPEVPPPGVVLRDPSGHGVHLRVLFAKDTAAVVARLLARFNQAGAPRIPSDFRAILGPTGPRPRQDLYGWLQGGGISATMLADPCACSARRGSGGQEANDVFNTAAAPSYRSPAGREKISVSRISVCMRRSSHPRGMKTGSGCGSLTGGTRPDRVGFFTDTKFQEMAKTRRRCGGSDSATCSRRCATSPPGGCTPSRRGRYRFSCITRRGQGASDSRLKVQRSFRLTPTASGSSLNDSTATVMEAW